MSYSVTCPSCATSFPVDPQKVPEEGVLAQCSMCPEVFEVTRPEESETVSSPEAGAVEVAVEEPVAEVDTPEVEAPIDAEDFVLETSEGLVGPETPAAVSTEVIEEHTDTMGGREITFDEPIVAPDAVAEPEAAVEETTVVEPDLELAEPVTDDAPAPAVEETPAAPITFGRRDPSDKAKSLARSLVSDIVAYHKEKHAQSLADGTLVADFEEEVEKSWKEYTDQVDADVVTNSTFFNDALNEILAESEDVFSLDG